MIEIKNLSKSYGENKVLQDFSLSIEEGKITCVLGESGSGKTTLLNAIAGLTDYEGHIDKIGTSYVFQKPNLFPNMTVEKNLSIVNKSIQEVNDILEDFGMADKKNSYPKHLSGGQEQRVALMRGLLFDAPLLLMDEPFVNLDLALKNSLINKFKDYQAKKPRTIIMVTHDIKEAVLLADRIIVLKKGEIVLDLTDIGANTEEILYQTLIK